MTSRGLRNENPGNVRYDGRTFWDGLDKPPGDPDFCRFVAPEYGLRVIALLMIAYQKYHDLHTVRGMIDRWAPPNENDTDAYVDAVAAGMGILPDEVFSATDPALLSKMIKAIVLQENGSQPYDDATIAKGMELAGVSVAT